jgi:signal peptide peptidase SppA
MSQVFEQARRMLNRPLALLRTEAEVLASLLQGRRVPSAMEDYGGVTRQATYERQYQIINGVAIVPINGVLFQSSCGWWDSTGYDWIRQTFLMALTDPDVRAIMLDINSPGGEVSGCFDLADTIYAARGDKPIWAVLNESAYSAAYALASAADRIVVPRTGGVGSVGVIWMHVDWSAALSEMGVKVTFITYGARKADGHPEIPLSKEAIERFQADIDNMGDLFVETVARNRNIAAAKVRETEAATLLGSDGVKIGFADSVMAPDAAFRALLKSIA